MATHNHNSTDVPSKNNEQENVRVATQSNNVKRKRRWGTIAGEESDINNSSAPSTLGSGVIPNTPSNNGVAPSGVTKTIPLLPQPGSNTFTNNGGVTVDPARAKILALQESIKARLEAAKRAAAGGGAVITTTSTSAAPVVQQQQQRQQQPPVAKKAKVYELDLTVTGPSYKDTNDASSNSCSQSAAIGVSGGITNEATADATTTTKTRKKQRWGTVQNQQSALQPTIPPRPTNPYLAHRIENDAATTEVLPVSNSASTNVENNVNSNDDVVDPRLVRVSKQRVRNKGFNFLEPGVWQERAEKVRKNEAKILESGFLTGRKKGHTVTAVSMAGIYGSAGIDDEIDNTVSTMLPFRADTNPDPNCFISMPSIMEWWDMELLPSKLRKQVAAIEQDKDTKFKLMPKAASKKKSKKNVSHNDDDVVMEDTSENPAENSASGTEGMEKLSAENIDNEIDIQVNGTHEMQQLRNLCYEQASLSHSKTAELVQHIVPIQPKVALPPGTTASTAAEVVNKKKEIVLHLTKKEMKRQRKLRRQEKQRELQDLQAAGLIPAPEPRLTLQNFFQVLGDTAVTDPSQMEKIVQKQIEARKQAHLERNAANKLTAEQRSQKKVAKLQTADTIAAVTQQITVALFYIVDITHPYHRTKIDKNAQQLNITGGVVETPFGSAGSCVIAEGNPRSIQRFIRLMTVRMKWTGPTGNDEDDNDNEDEEGDPDQESSRTKFNPLNKCVLIWKGLISKRSFHGFVFQDCPTAAQARKILKARGVEHYWDRIVDYHRLFTTHGGNTSAINLQIQLYNPNNNNESSFTHDDTDDGRKYNDADDNDDDRELMQE